MCKTRGTVLEVNRQVDNGTEGEVQRRKSKCQKERKKGKKVGEEEKE